MDLSVNAPISNCHVRNRETTHCEQMSLMKMAHRKTKMVTFRLSPEDYSHLVRSCSAQGVRSVSELARNAVRSIILASGDGQHSNDGNGSEASLQTQVQELRCRLADLSDHVDRLTRELGAITTADGSRSGQFPPTPTVAASIPTVPAGPHRVR